MSTEGSWLGGKQKGEKTGRKMNMQKGWRCERISRAKGMTSGTGMTFPEGMAGKTVNIGYAQICSQPSVDSEGREQGGGQGS